MRSLLNSLFACHHEFGWPITRNGITYRVCNNCGQERKWDMREMKFSKLTDKERALLQRPEFVKPLPRAVIDEDEIFRREMSLLWPARKNLQRPV